MWRQSVILPKAQLRSIYKIKQKNPGKKIPEVPLFSGPGRMLATLPFWASRKKALLRAYKKPPVELVVDHLESVNASNPLKYALEFSHHAGKCKVDLIKIKNGKTFLY